MTQADRHRWSREALGELPDDGNRYEIVDGELYVSDAPRPFHQVMTGRLFALLLQRCDAHPELGLMPLCAPIDIVLADDTVVEPDIVLVPVDLIGERDITGAPLVVIDVLAPSTRVVDLSVKKERMRRAGVAQYWIAHPGEPSLTGWRLVDDEYVGFARAVGEETFALTEPFTLDIAPARLLHLPGRG